MKNNYFAYDTLYFTKVWSSAEQFLNECKNADIELLLSDENTKNLFYLLYSRYGNSTIAFNDVTQFKYNVYSTIFMYGPTWQEKLDIQKKIRQLSDEEILQGGKSIYNMALNPDTPPSTSSLEEINFINSQNTTNHKRSKLEGYSLKWDLLATDVTEEFLGRFKKFFRKILDPECPVLFSNDEDQTETFLS